MMPRMDLPLIGPKPLVFKGRKQDGTIVEQASTRPEAAAVMAEFSDWRAAPKATSLYTPIQYRGVWFAYPLAAAVNGYPREAGYRPAPDAELQAYEILCDCTECGEHKGQPCLWHRAAKRRLRNLPIGVHQPLHYCTKCYTRWANRTPQIQVRHEKYGKAAPRGPRVPSDWHVGPVAQPVLTEADEPLTALVFRENSAMRFPRWRLIFHAGLPLPEAQVRAYAATPWYLDKFSIYTYYLEPPAKGPIKWRIGDFVAGHYPRLCTCQECNLHNGAVCGAEVRNRVSHGMFDTYCVACRARQRAREFKRKRFLEQHGLADAQH